MRSVWKGNYSDTAFDESILILKKRRPKSLIILPARNSTILKPFVGRKFAVHNGQTYARFTAKDFMVGHKFGEYSLTKKMGRLIHQKKKKK